MENSSLQTCFCWPWGEFEIEKYEGGQSHSEQKHTFHTIPVYALPWPPRHSTSGVAVASDCDL